jgi:Gpi18-like mannosyltransferase
MKRVFSYFLVWRILLFVVAFLATLAIAKFGNTFPYVDRVLTITNLPNWVWGFGNFDGVHYLRLAQNGYTAEYTQAFFPLYPLLIRLFNFLPKNTGLDLSLYTDPSYFYTGMLLSIVIFIPALYFLYKLWQEEYNQKISDIAILLLLSFPTAFYFGAIYSEALFLLLVVLVFWSVKKDKFILAGVFAALASATKIQGALLFVFLVIELWNKHRRTWRDWLGVFISPLGLVIYMMFLKQTVGDPLYFLTSQSAFGASRTSSLVLLPQVFYRYFKIMITVNPLTLNYFNALVEFIFTSVLIVGVVLAFKKIKFSYWVFVVLAVIMPTLTGTFSSMPRYALLAFPLLPLIAKYKRVSRYIIIAQSLVQIVLLALFIRGYWVA